jgi:predicted oxidoreductase (fatty acid repression mutant protein)
MADAFLELIKARRTTYAIEAKSPISDERIQQIASDVIKHTPSSFNCQSTRYVILLRDDHVRFWKIAKECFLAALSQNEYQTYKEKLDSRQAGYGTVSCRTFRHWEA